tara:strand:+ start:66 stop:467 length:402 start_codon:yes stop_codon:yes gene_type:complete
MSWQDILKRKLTVMEAVVEIDNVLSGYKNVEIESTRYLIDGYRNDEIKDIYDNLSYDSEDAPKPNTHEYMIQCNVYDEELKENYTGILFATYLDDDTKEMRKFLEKVMKLSFNDELEDAKEFLTPMNDDWMLE